MHFLTIAILLFSNLFIQISTSEESPQSFYTKKIDDDNNVWICFPEGQANITDGLNDQYPERLVVYLYKNPVTKEIKAFVPGPDKQALIPNFPASVSDTLKPVTTEIIGSLFNNQLGASGGSTKGDPIGLNKGKIKTISSKPADTKGLLNQSQPVDQPPWKVPQYPQLYLQDGYPTFDFNFGTGQSQEINLYDDVEYTTISDAHDNKTQDNDSWQSTSKPVTLPQTKPTAASEPSQAGLSSVKPQVYSPGSINKYLTFDQWFIEQMKTFQDVNLPDDVKAIDSDLLRSLVQKKLFENQLSIDATGLITDADGIPINAKNLELRPILIGNSFNYQSLQDNQQVTLPKDLPYLEGILVTLVYPPKILGVIPVGKTYVSKPDLVISKNKVTHVDTPALIKHYTDSSSPIKPSNPLSVTASPFTNYGSFISPVKSSPKIYQKPSSALNPFSVTGSLSSSLNLPFLSNLYESVPSPLFPKGLFNPQPSGVWIRRSNKPKKSEKLKHKAAKLIKVAKKLEEEATKLEQEAVKLEKVAKKEAKTLEHVAEKLEEEAKKEVKKLKKEAKKLKKHAEKSKANKDCLTSCPEPKEKLPSEPKPSAGPKPPSEPKSTSDPKPESGPHPPLGPKSKSVPHPPSGSKQKSGPQPPSGPKPKSGLQPPPGPKPESGPQPSPGSKPKSGPQSLPGPQPKSSGPQLPPDPKSESSILPPPGPKPPLEPKPPPGLKPKSDSHPPPSTNPEPGTHPPSDPKSKSGPHPPSGRKPDSEPKPLSKPESESEKSHRRLGSQDLPPYNLDWYLNNKNPIPPQIIGALPASTLNNIIWGKSSPGSNSLAKPRSDSNRVKDEFNNPSVYKKDSIYLDDRQKLDSNAGYLTAMPYFGKWNFPPKPNKNHTQLVVTSYQDSKWNLQDPNAPELSIRPFDNKSHFNSKIKTKPTDLKWHDFPKINSKTPKWSENQNIGNYKYPPTHDSNSPHLIATPIDDKWEFDSKTNNKPSKWGHKQNNGKDTSFLHLTATPFNSEWNSDSKLENNLFYSKWSDASKTNKLPQWADNQNDYKFKNYPTQYTTSTPKIDPNSPWAAYIAAHKNVPHSDVNLYNDKWTAHATAKSSNVPGVDVSSYPKIDPHYGRYDFMKALPTLPPLSLSPLPYYPWKNIEFNKFPKKNSFFPKSNNPDMNVLSRLGNPYWHPRPKSPVNNERRTYDQVSAEIGTEESIEDFHQDSEKIQHEVGETPSRRSDSPIKTVFKSLLDMVVKNLIKEISGGGAKRRMTDEPIDINATATNPIELEGAEDDHPDFRIIGGSAATGSGSPLSNKGRSGVNLNFY